MNKMKNLWWSLILLGILAFAHSKDCFGEDCEFQLEGDPQEVQQPSIADVVPEVDREIRRSYWYYLRRSNLLFQANVETEERYIHFFIYRNRVGTFLVIASWDRKQRFAEINTFVRLGDGYEKDVTNLYNPVNINPFIISLKLGFGELLIELDEDGNFFVDGEMINTQGEGKDIKLMDVEEKTKILDEHIRSTYWYYLLDALLVHTQSIQSTKRLYVVLTYVNIVGTFLVIASCDVEDNIQVNTFVRLGRGSDKKKIEAIPLKPAVIELDSY